MWSPTKLYFLFYDFVIYYDFSNIQSKIIKKEKGKTTAL